MARAVAGAGAAEGVVPLAAVEADAGDPRGARSGAARPRGAAGGPRRATPAATPTERGLTTCSQVCYFVYELDRI